MANRQILLVALVVAATALSSAAQQITPLDVRVPRTPIPFQAAGHPILAYELRVTNVSGRDLTLFGIDVRRDSAGGSVLQQLRGEELRGDVTPIGGRDTTVSALTIRSGRQAVVFMWLDLERRAPAPRNLAHQILFNRPDSLGNPPDTTGPVIVRVETRKPPGLASPLEDGLWLARNGPSSMSDHRRTLVSVNGVSRIAQRFATDWIMLGPDHRLWKGDSTVNQNWYGYNTSVRAAGAGVIVELHDGIPENLPLSSARAVPITLETVAGNYIIERLDAGGLAVYAHLVPGSLQVRVGERVATGKSLARLGNSGNSGAPHLHFHVMDEGVSALGGEGIPFVFDRFSDEGVLRSPDELFGANEWQQKTHTIRRRESPVENTVVRFSRHGPLQ